MPWPSKDPDDYAERGRWEGTGAPRWLRILLRRSPDSVPYWMSMTASATGFFGGLAVGQLAGWDEVKTAVAGGLLLQILLDAGWWLNRRRRSA
jgi:hypothetical protein